MEAQGIIEHERFSMEIVIINLVRSKNIWTRQNILILAQIYFGPVEGQSNTRLRPPPIKTNSLWFSIFILAETITQKTFIKLRFHVKIQNWISTRLKVLQSQSLQWLNNPKYTQNFVTKPQGTSASKHFCK